MRYYAQFHAMGYSTPFPDDYEVFNSISSIKEELRNRFDFNPKFPCVENDASFIVWKGTPSGIFPCDCYPDIEIYFGPRNGVRTRKL